MMAEECKTSCFECPFRDCVASPVKPTEWEKGFNKRNQKIRQRKRLDHEDRQRKTGSYGTMLGLKLR